MIKTYYKFHIDKENLIKEAQDSWEWFTCITWIYVDAVGEPDLGLSTIKCQDWSFIVKWIPERIGEWVEWEVVVSAQSLDWFLIEKLRCPSLEWEYYEKFYIS